MTYVKSLTTCISYPSSQILINYITMIIPMPIPHPSLPPQLKSFAQGALSAYLKSVHLQPNKAMFDVSSIDAAELALSMGLASLPRLRFLRERGGRIIEGGGEVEGGDGSGGSEGGGGSESGGSEGGEGWGVGSGGDEDEDGDGDGDLLAVKRTHRWDVEVRGRG